MKYFYEVRFLFLYNNPSHPLGKRHQRDTQNFIILSQTKSSQEMQKTNEKHSLLDSLPNLKYQIKFVEPNQKEN